MTLRSERCVARSATDGSSRVDCFAAAIRSVATVVYLLRNVLLPPVAELMFISVLQSAEEQTILAAKQACGDWEKRPREKATFQVTCSS